MENFKYGFENMFMDTVIKRREMNENMFARLMDDTGIREFVMSHLLPWVYRRLRENGKKASGGQEPFREKVPGLPKAFD